MIQINFSRRFYKWKLRIEESRGGCCSLLCLCYSCTEERKVVYFPKIVDRLLRNYQLRIKCECTKLLSERPVIQFICRGQCYQRLTTFKRALYNLNKAKGEIEEVFKANVHRTKRLRRKEQIEEDIEEEIDEQLGQSARAISSRKIVSRVQTARAIRSKKFVSRAQTSNSMFKAN